MTYLGIDPGRNGFIAVIVGRDAKVAPLPYDDKFLDVCALRSILLEVRPDFAVVESPQLRTGQQGTKAIYSNYGRILATLTLLGIGYEEASPAKWQNAVIGETNKGDKSVCVAKAKQLYPTVEVTKESADSLLIAEFCRRKA